MFSDFKSRGFGLEQSQLQTPDRLSRLLLVMSLALYFAVSTGQWDAVANPTVTKKNATPSAKEPEPRPLVLVRQRAAAHRQDGDVRIAAASALGIRMKLMGVQPSRLRRPRLAIEPYVCYGFDKNSMAMNQLNQAQPGDRHHLENDQFVIVGFLDHRHLPIGGADLVTPCE